MLFYRVCVYWNTFYKEINNLLAVLCEVCVLWDVDGAYAGVVPFVLTFLEYVVLDGDCNGVVKVVVGLVKPFIEIKIDMSRDMRFPTMWYFDKCRLRRACVASF